MQCGQQCYVLGLLWGQCNNLVFNSEIASMLRLDDFCFIIGFNVVMTATASLLTVLMHAHDHV